MTDESAADGPEGCGQGPAQGGPGQPGAGNEPAGPVPLLRSRRHRVVAGVCGGLGRYFDIDPVIFRVVLAVLALTGGVGLLFYGIAWLFIPVPGDPRNEAQRLLSGRVEGSGMAAVLTALAGSGVFLSTLGTGGEPYPLFVILAVLGAIYLSQRRRGSAAPAWVASRGAAGPVADAPPAAQPPPAPSQPSWWKDEPSARPYLWGPDYGDRDSRTREQGEGNGDERQRPGPPAKPPGSRQPRPLLGLALFCLAVLAGALGTAASWSSPLGTALQIGSACALSVLGAGLVVGSFFGRVRGGTIFLGVLVAVVLAGSAALPKSVDEEWQRSDWAPTSAAEVQPLYELGTGHGTLDLTRVDPGTEEIRVRVEVGAGILTVRVPDTVTVGVRGRAGVGVVRLPGDEEHETDVSVNARGEKMLEPARPVRGRGGGRFWLSLEAGVGLVEVIREAP